MSKLIEIGYNIRGERFNIRKGKLEYSNNELTRLNIPNGCKEISCDKNVLGLENVNCVINLI